MSTYRKIDYKTYEKYMDTDDKFNNKSHNNKKINNKKYKDKHCIQNECGVGTKWTCQKKYKEQKYLINKKKDIDDEYETEYQDFLNIRYNSLYFNKLNNLIKFHELCTSHDGSLHCSNCNICKHLKIKEPEYPEAKQSKINYKEIILKKKLMSILPNYIKLPVSIWNIGYNENNYRNYLYNIIIKKIPCVQKYGLDNCEIINFNDGSKYVGKTINLDSQFIDIKLDNSLYDEFHTDQSDIFKLLKYQSDLRIKHNDNSIFIVGNSNNIVAYYKITIKDLIISEGYDESLSPPNNGIKRHGNGRIFYPNGLYEDLEFYYDIDIRLNNSYNNDILK